ncbi:endonuclease/exonuclease/phosphatase family protein [Daejeonella lutea]|uniref:Exodeoxyribonuclease-3 n=1 Tax=Daejeonella lutea TaxID=572036 RepID=A0A1T5AYB7_9SPHI|nr:endonuclease/exonuclease/phosphatase family protein [Daejeonella lutea]SKB39750.1 exodeoxyribonuclease-3 [Daejeonella lutea]
MVRSVVKRYFLVLFVMIGLQGSLSAQERPLRLLTYNILQGMRLDSAAGKPKFTAWIKELDPDIIAMQEVTDFTQASLEELARGYGHPYAVLLIEGEKYPVALTSKFPITNVQKVTDNMDRGMIQANIRGYSVGVLHLTPFDYRKAREEIAVVLAQVASSAATNKWILMGDFNSLSPQDSLNYKDGRIIQNLKNYEKNYPPRKKLDNGQIDYQVISHVLAAGFLDGLRLIRKDFVKTVHPKAFEPKTGTDITSRIDFIFVSRDLKNQVHSAKVVMDSFTDKYSDHYPVFMELSTK